MPADKHELPTAEQAIKGAYVEDNLDARPGGKKRVRRLDSDELDRMLFAKEISVDQHVTLERFRGDLYRAGLVFCPRAGAEVAGATGQGAFLADVAFHRARRVAKQMDMLAGALSAKQLNILLAALTMDQRVDRKDLPAVHEAVTILDQFYQGG